MAKKYFNGTVTVYDDDYAPLPGESERDYVLRIAGVDIDDPETFAEPEWDELCQQQCERSLDWNPSF